MEIASFQQVVRDTYFDRDAERGVDGTFRWFTEEVGEVAGALRGKGDLVHELGDVLAWLSSLASLVGVSLEEAAERYANGCPRCGGKPCTCAFVR
jgi:NTP pyrophosphatase (non-canonical NTP hydrolase)